MISGTFEIFRFLVNKEHGRHVPLLRALSGAMVLVLVMATIVVAADDKVTKLDEPVPAVVKLTDGQALRGHVIATNIGGFVLQDFNNNRHEVQWSDLIASSVYELHLKLHDQHDVHTWLTLGQRLLARDDGERLGRVALNRANVLGDNEVKEQVTTVLADYEAKKQAQAKAAEDARRSKEGRFFSSERVKAKYSPRVRFTPTDGEQQQGWVWTYDRHGFELGNTFDRPANERKAEDGEHSSLRNTFAWGELPPDEALAILSQLLRDRPAESWFNAGSMLLHRGANGQAERVFTIARRLDRRLVTRISDLKDQVRQQQTELAARRHRHHAQLQKIILTGERTKLWEPLPVEINLGKQAAPLKGELIAFDGTNLYLVPTLASASGGAVLGPGERKDSEKRLPWSSMPSEAAFGLLDQLLDKDNSGGWFRAGRLLMRLEDGDAAARRAFTRAHTADPKLAEPIRQVYNEALAARNHSTQANKNSTAAPSSSGGITSFAKPREGDARANAEPGEVVIRTDFESGLQHPIRRLGPARFEITLPSSRDTNGFFLFRLENTKGRTVQVEFVSRRAERHWATLNPVYSYGHLDDPDNFIATPRSDGSALVRSANGILIPQVQVGSDPQKDQLSTGWHYISTVWSEGDRICLRQSFDQEAAYLAMKYPYTPGLCDAYMSQLEQREKQARDADRDPGFKVYRVGETKEKRPLWLLAIGSDLDDKKKQDRRPCVLMYAREHGDEHDSSWPVQGAAEFLLTDTAEARQLRNNFVFLLVPMLDPDGAADNVYENIIRSFREGDETLESKTWAKFFHHWMLDGHRLDLVLNLHNVESDKGPHVFPAQFEPGDERGKAARLFNSYLTSQLKAFDYTYRTSAGEGISRFRLGGHLHRYYGSLHQPYEINSQSPDRHLNLYELKVIGPLLVRSAMKYFNDHGSYDIQQETVSQQAAWHRRVKRYASFFDHKTIFGLEHWCMAMPLFEQEWIKERREYPTAYVELQSTNSALPQLMTGVFAP